jgi:hypothetical protein
MPSQNAAARTAESTTETAPTSARLFIHEIRDKHVTMARDIVEGSPNERALGVLVRICPLHFVGLGHRRELPHENIMRQIDEFVADMEHGSTRLLANTEARVYALAAVIGLYEYLLKNPSSSLTYKPGT